MKHSKIPLTQTRLLKIFYFVAIKIHLVRFTRHKKNTVKTNSCFITFVFFTAGLGWNTATQLNIFSNSSFIINDCQVSIKFAFTDLFKMFTRETEKTTRTGKSKISFAEFAVYHSAEPLFQQMRVNTSFDHLDYNFFAEQFSKVKI